MQGATSHDTTPDIKCKVSIHAPYAGSDHQAVEECTELLEFQSTPPMQGATNRMILVDTFIDVSIHAPYAGSDG